MIIPVVLAGGAGTRLWPLSTPERPKPFIRFGGGDGGTLLAATLRRVAGKDGLAAPVIVANADHRPLIVEEIARANVVPQTLILEPVARGTAAAVAVAALLAQRNDPLAVLAVMPCDHLVEDEPAFVEALRQAARVAETDTLVLFGIRPTVAHTGYGYIRQGAPLDGHAGAFAVAAFCEKPDRARAEAYVAAGDYFWNSGIFVMRACTYLAELQRLAPHIHAAAHGALAFAAKEDGALRLEPTAFAAAPAMSIDRAVMEKTERAAMLPLDVGWSDIGSWAALRAAVSRNDYKSAVAGEARQQHPWGYTETLHLGERFHAALVHVKPGGIVPPHDLKCHRGHWVVVRGTTKVVTGDQETLVPENGSIDVSAERLFRLENAGEIPLELIDVERDI